MSDKCQCIGEWTAGCPLHDPDLLVTPPIPESLRERLAATLNELHSHARASKDGETMGHVDADAVLPLIEAELQTLLAAQLQAAAGHVPELILQARIVVCSCGWTAQLVTKPGTFAEQWQQHILALTHASVTQAQAEREGKLLRESDGRLISCEDKLFEVEADNAHLRESVNERIAQARLEEAWLAQEKVQMLGPHNYRVWLRQRIADLEAATAARKETRGMTEAQS